jgi:glycosyltransferase involved in cell wall biosynthesis
VTALIRVFVTTYRRPHLLRRALDSLRAQTFQDWVGEVHNDAPDDPVPGEIVRSAGDSRLHYRPHPANLGAVATFNQVFQGCAEPYTSLLEDDNWWEPGFLATLLEILQPRPRVPMVWCNQRVWAERADGTWRDTGACVNPAESAPRSVPWGGFRQALGAHHSNGAMLLRTRPDKSFQTPPDLPFSGMEAFRERLLPHPLFYTPEPLGHFALTLATARKHDRASWSAFQTVLLATYVRHARLDAAGRAALLAFYRAHQPPPSNVFIQAALVCRECRPFLAQMKPAEWLRYARGFARRPAAGWQALRVRTRRPEWWRRLDQATAERFAEQRALS